MFMHVAKSLMTLLFAIIFSVVFNIASVNAITFSFKSPGKIGDEGVLTGKITYDQDDVNLALNDPNKRSSTLALDELGKERKFKFEYISPFSGIKHTENTLCKGSIGYDITDISRSSSLSSLDERGPFFLFSSPEYLGSFNLVSCVGERGKLDSSVSERNSSVAFSELQILFGRGTIIDADYTGTKSGRLYMRKFPIDVKFESD